ncbi:MAG: hypothetical protein MK073_06900 [Phycisphaerales bacterium]|nr:hypothetical protein [Phycisphaerales bacterium]
MSSEKDASNPATKVLFVTEDDPLYVIQFFDVFFKEYPKDEIDVIGITVVDAFHEPIWKTAWRMYKFYGPIDFVRLGCRFVWTKLKGRSIKTIAQEAGINVIDTHSVNDASYIEEIKRLNPEVIASVAAPEVFKEEILNAPSKACVNIHSGRLPIYRGMMPNFWQLLHQEEHATITIHEMAEQLDAGGIISTKAFPLREKDTLNRVIIGTKQEGARLMIDVLSDFDTKFASKQTLDMSEAKYFSFPTPKDVKALRRVGHKML